MKKGSPGFDKSRPLAPLNTNVREEQKLTAPRIRVSQPTPKRNDLTERQKVREDMRKKEAELLEKIKQQKANLDMVKQRKVRSTLGS